MPTTGEMMACIGRIYDRTAGRGSIAILLALVAGCAGSRIQAPASQNPSPMQEHTRRHDRISAESWATPTFWIVDGLPGKASAFIPDAVRKADSYDILVHFHGSAFVANTAVAQSNMPIVAVNVHLGSGSSVYELPFLDESTFPQLLETVRNGLSSHGISSERPPLIYLSAFSAGYGAIRAILSTPNREIEGVLLLDALHTDYLPERTVLSEGGSLEVSKLAPFVSFAKEAIEGRTRFVITHSEIFPGTFASTTETSDYLLDAIGLRRQPVLEWGPVGMQLLSRAESGRLTVLGFAGNTAPDHVDHFHGLPAFLSMLVE